jgi:ABC-type lipoprotein export system ATPase subunit
MGRATAEPGHEPGRGRTLVRVDNVSRSIDHDGERVVVLAPTTITLETNTVVAVAGPSGSGKTTLCNIVAGWDHSDTGVIEWIHPQSPPEPSGRATRWWRVSVAPQRLALHRSLTLGENLALPFWGSDRPLDPAAAADIGEALDIGELLGRRVDEVSLGEQQRVAVARALLGAPDLAILDEPTGHQDEERSDLVIAQLLRASRSGTCVLVATHDERVIARADQVVTLR